MGKLHGGNHKRSSGSGESSHIPRGRNSRSKTNEKGSGVNGRARKRKLRPYREYPSKPNSTILESAVARSAGTVEEGIAIKTNAEVKEIAKNLPTPWGNHRFLLIVIILGMILVTLGTGMLRSYILEKDRPDGGWSEYLKKEHKRQDKQFHMLYGHLQKQNCPCTKKEGK